MTTGRFTHRPVSQPLDRVAIALIVILAGVMGLLIFSGDHAVAKVRNFSWEDRQIGAENIAFLMTFSRPMDPASVEADLRIEPALPGKFSWAGRRMAYTLDAPAPYGEAYQVTLADARDRFNNVDRDGQSFQPFQAQFQTRDRAFVYLGVAGDEANRLVLFNLTRQEKHLLTPSDWVVMDFKPYPLGNYLLFSATDRTAYQQGRLDQKLYRVATGLQPQAPEDPGQPTNRTLLSIFRRSSAAPPVGEIEQLLDSEGYQNLKFDLSPDGRVIVVQRLSKANPAEFGPWVLVEGKPAQPLETEPGGEFLIAPDSQTLVMLQGEGTAILPLPVNSERVSSEPLDFLPQYGRVFDLADDGSAALMVNFNQDDPDKRYIQSLVLVTSQGEEKELIQVTGAILDARFDPTNRTVYALISELLPGEKYVEQPFITAIGLKTGERQDLLKLLPQPQAQMSLAPDGLGLLFNQLVPALDETGHEIPDTMTSQIWFLPLFKTPEERLNATPAPMEPELLPLSGANPAWLP